MDRRQFFGESVLNIIFRLVLISIVVGVVFTTLNLTPWNLVERLEAVIRGVVSLGINAFSWALKYFIVGAVIVLPIWFVSRLLRRRDPPV